MPLPRPPFSLSPSTGSWVVRFATCTVPGSRQVEDSTTWSINPTDWIASGCDIGHSFLWLQCLNAAEALPQASNYGLVPRAGVQSGLAPVGARYTSWRDAVESSRALRARDWEDGREGAAWKTLRAVTEQSPQLRGHVRGWKFGGVLEWTR